MNDTARLTAEIKQLEAEKQQYEGALRYIAAAGSTATASELRRHARNILFVETGK